MALVKCSLGLISPIDLHYSPIPGCPLTVFRFRFGRADVPNFGDLERVDMIELFFAKCGQLNQAGNSGSNQF